MRLDIPKRSEVSQWSLIILLFNSNRAARLKYRTKQNYTHIISCVNFIGGFIKIKVYFGQDRNLIQSSSSFYHQPLAKGMSGQYELERDSLRNNIISRLRLFVNYS